MHKGQSDMKTKRYAKILAFSFFSAFAFFLNYQIVEPGNDFDLTSRGMLRVFKLLVAILDSIELILLSAWLCLWDLYSFIRL